MADVARDSKVRPTAVSAWFRGRTTSKNIADAVDRKTPELLGKEAAARAAEEEVVSHVR